MEYENPIGDFYYYYFCIYFGFEYLPVQTETVLAYLQMCRLIPAKSADPLFVLPLQKNQSVQRV